MSYEKVSILGVDFINTTMNEMIARLGDHLEKEEKAFVVTANPEIVLAAHNDQDYQKLLAKANYITADGIGVVKAAQLLGQPLPERVTGFDMFMALLQLANEKSYKLYLLGAKPEVLEKTKQAVESQFPNVTIVGSHHGFFEWDEPTIENEIKETEPDLVFVALGFPRQEKWISERISSFNKGIFIGIGGSFDVLAGEVNRAPEIWQKLNVEWLYRLIQQPSRWKRMMALPIFAGKVIGQKVKGSK
ncbi:WecB/TagA/CpsF family glycosyltransferase [Desertibacillus haloalkaliphilus]|uniref:WecB/TagA/CpsF family glycosyltransferase n=1 Tax=Desertibacillus haloalkaliphilus TaxID=1328930 RepID=UPI001C25FE24|nr:WecB/TagA/CpsF family glycosyltransferase [Desertibacillus haloalkaliphilus]MBU8905970.1 WecB/TagA/CpsF family glycosyltransferase [Desertibacillus haloalkaliphilus]